MKTLISLPQSNTVCIPITIVSSDSGLAATEQKQRVLERNSSNAMLWHVFEDCTVWSPVTDHYVNKVIFFSVNSKCQDCFYVADKGIISSND